MLSSLSRGRWRDIAGETDLWTSGNFHVASGKSAMWVSELLVAPTRATGPESGPLWLYIFGLVTYRGKKPQHGLCAACLWPKSPPESPNLCKPPPPDSVLLWRSFAHSWAQDPTAHLGHYWVLLVCPTDQLQSGNVHQSLCCPMVYPHLLQWELNPFQVYSFQAVPEP